LAGGGAGAGGDNGERAEVEHLCFWDGEEGWKEVAELPAEKQDTASPSTCQFKVWDSTFGWQ